MKNIHILPTGKPSRLYEGNLGKPVTIQFASAQIKKPLNIYITSDEEIKEGDWVIVNKKYIRKVDITFNKQDSDWNVLNTNKIIITTDTQLIKDNVQAIDGSKTFITKEDLEKLIQKEETKTLN